MEGKYIILGGIYPVIFPKAIGHKALARLLREKEITSSGFVNINELLFLALIIRDTSPISRHKKLYASCPVQPSEEPFYPSVLPWTAFIDCLMTNIHKPQTESEKP